MQRSTIKTFLSVAILFVAAAGCKKTKVATSPSLALKETSSKEIPLNGDFEATFSFTDKEGDADSLYVIRRRLNLKGPETKAPLAFSVPKTGGEAEGEIETILFYVRGLTLNFNPLGPSTNRERDTLSIRYVLKDRKKNTSDTVTIDNVIVTRQ
ncbi:MAG: hypothetical protein JWP27_593 [Flaviaesturariibacter sp.]|nr:hypothetical protein [Flaviaesturariibacter sp.]